MAAAGANVHLCNTTGQPPLLNAVVRGHLPMVKALLSEKVGANVESRDNNKRPVLHHAIECGHYEVGVRLSESSCFALSSHYLFYGNLCAINLKVAG